MPPEHHRDADEGPTGTFINEGTKIDLKTAMMMVMGVLGLAGAISRSELAMNKMDAALRAEIVSVRTDTEKSSDAADKTQDSRLTALENRLEQIQVTNCAIARKLDVATTGCGRDR